MSQELTPAKSAAITASARMASRLSARRSSAAPLPVTAPSREAPPLAVTAPSPSPRRGRRRSSAEIIEQRLEAHDLRRSASLPDRGPDVFRASRLAAYDRLQAALGSTVQQ